MAPNRNTKLTAQDVRKYCVENEVRIEIRDYGDLVTIGLRKHGMFIPLPEEVRDTLYGSIIQLMTAEGVHARINS
jgi:hypothetical protein